MSELSDRLKKHLLAGSAGDRAYEKPMSWDEALRLVEEIEAAETALSQAKTILADITFQSARPDLAARAEAWFAEHDQGSA